MSVVLGALLSPHCPFARHSCQGLVGVLETQISIFVCLCCSPEYVTAFCVCLGHDESSTSFRCFLRERLTANQPLAPKHVALDTTTVFLPCIALEVPFIDTPGTGDTDVLNEFVTQAAMDDAIHDSSQILLCGTKSFKAEATVGPLVIQYMQHMITSTSDTPCIRGVLLPETSGRYTHKAVCSEADQQTCHDRVNTSLDQLQKWMQLANQKLPQQHRADPARLKVLLGRCEVRVVYMNLYASLCHQAPGDLKALADDVSSTERPVTAEKLLDNTGGPWLLGEHIIAHSHTQSCYQDKPCSISKLSVCVQAGCSWLHWDLGEQQKDQVSIGQGAHRIYSCFGRQLGDVVSPSLLSQAYLSKLHKYQLGCMLCSMPQTVKHHKEVHDQPSLPELTALPCALQACQHSWQHKLSYLSWRASMKSTSSSLSAHSEAA